MAILVAYASKLGSTEAIAERIAATLRAGGQEADVLSVGAVEDVDQYHAFVIGSSVYYGHWRKEAAEFLRRHRSILAARPVWLFSSGPLGDHVQDVQARDLSEVAEPREVVTLWEAIGPRDHQIFFGALEHDRLGFVERVITHLPVGATLFPEGDFRDWADIEEWAESIRHELKEMADSTL